VAALDRDRHHMLVHGHISMLDELTAKAEMTLALKASRLGGNLGGSRAGTRRTNGVGCPTRNVHGFAASAPATFAASASAVFAVSAPVSSYIEPVIDAVAPPLK